MQLWVLVYTIHSSHYISCSDTYEKRPTNYENKYTTMGCRYFGLSTFWFVDVLVCRRFGLSTFWSVDVLVCQRFGLSTFRFVDVLVVDVSVCRRFDQ